MTDKLKEALDLVVDFEDWREPIKAHVTQPMLDKAGVTIQDVEQAVIHFTGTVATVQPTKNGWLVRAIGYRNGPCGP